MRKDGLCDISTTFCGLRLRSPIVVGACPMTLNSEKVRQFTIAGAGAVVLPSLFEEQVVTQWECTPSNETQQRDAERNAYGTNRYNLGTQEYLLTIARLKRQVGIPIFANLNGCTPGYWLSFATQLQSAGVDGIEAAFDGYVSDVTVCPTKAEQNLMDMVTQLCEVVSIPVSVKLSPFHSNLSNLAARLTECGASGVTCFGFEPEWDVSTTAVSPSTTWNPNASGCVNQSIAGVAKVKAAGMPLSVAASGGVTSTEECIKTLLAGADVAMVTSEVYRSGPDAIAHIVEGLTRFVERTEFANLGEILACRPTPMFSRSAWLSSLTKQGELRV